MLFNMAVSSAHHTSGVPSDLFLVLIASLLTLFLLRAAPDLTNSSRWGVHQAPGCALSL
jgi:hypothetical protein